MRHHHHHKPPASKFSHHFSFFFCAGEVTTIAGHSVQAFLDGTASSRHFFAQHDLLICTQTYFLRVMSQRRRQGGSISDAAWYHSRIVGCTTGDSYCRSHQRVGSTARHYAFGCRRYPYVSTLPKFLFPFQFLNRLVLDNHRIRLITVVHS
jgi:hypothetical protein